MFLARRTQHAFTDRIRRRGLDYQRARSVSIRSVDGERVVAEVQGSEGEPWSGCSAEGSAVNAESPDVPGSLDRI